MAVVQRAAQIQKKRGNATQEDQTDGDDQAEENDDSDSEDSADVENATTAGPPPLALAAGPQPGDELESLTPQGKVDKARQQLQDNLRRQAEIAAAIAEQGNDTDFDRRGDEQAGTLAAETQTKALASVLGTMRKEMRKFASPFYMEHLITEQRQLKATELQLEAALEKAEANLQGRMMESNFQPSSALRAKAWS